MYVPPSWEAFVQNSKVLSEIEGRWRIPTTTTTTDDNDGNNEDNNDDDDINVGNDDDNNGDDDDDNVGNDDDKNGNDDDDDNDGDNNNGGDDNDEDKRLYGWPTQMEVDTDEVEGRLNNDDDPTESTLLHIPLFWGIATIDHQVDLPSMCNNSFHHLINLSQEVDKEKSLDNLTENQDFNG